MVLPALRIWKADTISNTPMTTSQMPATRAKMTIESNGHARTTIPAMMLVTATKIAHPRPGRPSVMNAYPVVATPKKMNPTAIHMHEALRALPDTEIISAPRAFARGLSNGVVLRRR
jgi:hypothetical protein